MQNLDVTISVTKIRNFLSTTEWICVILTVVFAAIVIALATVHSDLESQRQTANKLRGRCITPECFDAAMWLMGNMDETVDPCQRFYDNACLSYSKRNPISETASDDTSVMANLRTVNRMRLHAIVQTPFVPGQWGELDKTAQRANAYYTACIDQYQRAVRYPDADNNPLIKIIEKQLGQQWYVKDPTKISSFDYEKTMREMTLDQNFVFFNMRPILGPGEKSKHYLTFSPDDSSSFPREWRRVGSYWSNKNAFREKLLTLGRLIARDYGLNLTDRGTQQTLVTFVTDVVNVMGFIEMTMRRAFDSGRTEKYRAIYTWDEWKQLVASEKGNFDFDSYVKKYTGFALEPTTKVMEHVSVNEYFIYTKNMLTLLMRLKDSNEQVFKRQMNNYLTYRIAFFWMPHLSYEYNHLRRQFEGGPVSELRPEWETCLDQMTYDMPKALSALYVSHHYDSSSEDTINKITSMINDSLYKEVDSLSWMDEETRNAARNKLKAIIWKIGKPSAWADDSAIAKEMERHYNGITLDPTDHLGNAVKLIPIRRSEDIRKLQDGPGAYNPIDDWRAEMYDPRIDYYGRWNEILIPAGVVQEPLVSPRYPTYMNFGGIGTFIASALISAIDEEGQILDGNNMVTNWWGPLTWDNYLKLKSQMVDYYNYTTPQIIQDFSNITNFAFWGIRETGAVRQAYLAYRRFLETYGIGDEQALPSLSHGDLVQNFFYAYAGSRCDSWASEASITNVFLLNKMPTFLRVDGSVSQISEFLIAFGCVGSSEDMQMVPPNDLRVLVF